MLPGAHNNKHNSNGFVRHKALRIELTYQGKGAFIYMMLLLSEQAKIEQRFSCSSYICTSNALFGQPVIRKRAPGEHRLKVTQRKRKTIRGEYLEVLRS